MEQRRVLLFGGQQRSATDLPVPQDDRFRLTYCASDNHSVDAVIEQVQHRFDWILIDGAEMGGDQMEFFRFLRAIGFLLSEGVPDAGRLSPCRVEWDRNGTLQLCCGRKTAARGKRHRRPAGADEAGDGFVFEYHAPMEKTG
jgi:hypothetical protein